MLASLSIQNFALIAQLEMDFSGGLSIITGETGSGKSIMLGALGLVLGNRADLSSLQNKDEKCVIEAQFRLDAYPLQPFFESNDLDYESQTIIRREILPSGKSRAFINDTPVNLQQLQELGEFLIDIHSQHETRALSDSDFQFAILDAVASNAELLGEYTGLLHTYKKTTASRNQAHALLSERLKERDYNHFLFEELEAAAFAEGEQERLEAQQQELANVSQIREQLDRALGLASDEQYGVGKSLREMRGNLSKLAAFSESYRDLSGRLESLFIEFDDLTSELEQRSEQLLQDPEALERTNERLQLLYNLLKKHQASDVAALLEIKSTLEDKVVSVQELEAAIADYDKQCDATAAELDTLAAKLHEKRSAAVPELVRQWRELLAQLGMPDADFKVELTASDQFLPQGKEQLQVLFSANKGGNFGLLRKTASGGELSRIMLATKAILARHSQLPTIVFDEIDTGVSGEIANKMGEIMKAMSASMQVIAITHLPQIAAKGDVHFKVFKSNDSGKTRTSIQKLEYDDRITEIAQMLSGANVSDSAINHAKALLD